MRRPWASLAVLLLAPLVLESRAWAGEPERLERDHQPVLRDFSDSRARARLVTILSPT